MQERVMLLKNHRFASTRTNFDAVQVIMAFDIDFNL